MLVKAMTVVLVFREFLMQIFKKYHSYSALHSRVEPFNLTLYQEGGNICM